MGFAHLSTRSQRPRTLNSDHFLSGAGAAGAGATGAGAAGFGCVTADWAARSNTLAGSALGRAPMYASVRLVAKNIAANTAVNFENKVLVPRAPNTVPEAPEPNPAPASAPLPLCMSTSKMIISASKTCTPRIIPRNIRNLSMASGRSRAYLLKLIGAQRSATYQSAVHVGHREQLRRVAGLYAATVEDPQMARYLSILRVNAIAQERVHRLRLLRRSRAARPDGPHRFIGEDGPRKAPDPVHRDHRVELPRNDRFSLIRLALVQGFSYAQHRHQPSFQHRRKFARHQRVILVIPAAPFRVADDHVGAAHILEHRGAHLTGERTAGLRADILRADRNASALECANRIAQIDIRRKNRDIDRPVRLQAHFQFGEQRFVGGPRAVHFPITRDHLTTH